MRPSFRRSAATKHRLVLSVEPFERRALLSSSAGTNASGGSRAAQDVAIRVPSPYVAQQASELNVTLVRTPAAGRRRLDGPLTVEFSAFPASPSSGAQTAPISAKAQFTPIDQFVTFPAGQATERVSVPIKIGAPKPDLVPIVLAVTPSKPNGPASKTTVYLVSGPDAIPPSIIGVHMKKRGIAVTFSKPMAPATVENVHNYAVEYTPSQEFNVTDLTGVGLIQRLSKTARSVALQRAQFDPSTNTVILVPKGSLPASGTYQVASPPSLGSTRSGPHKAQPLSDLQGNVLDPGGAPVSGAFSISIRRGHPYVQNQPTLWDGP
jgi:hypothetical protein